MLFIIYVFLVAILIGLYFIFGKRPETPQQHGATSHSNGAKEGQNSSKSRSNDAGRMGNSNLYTAKCNFIEEALKEKRDQLLRAVPKRKILFSVSSIQEKSLVSFKELLVTLAQFSHLDFYFAYSVRSSHWVSWIGRNSQQTTRKLRVWSKAPFQTSFQNM